MASEPYRRFLRSVLPQVGGMSLRLGLFLILGRWVTMRLGSPGVATWGQIQNLIGLGSAVGIVALQSGFQQGVARRLDFPALRRRWVTVGWAGSLGLTLLSGLVVWGLALSGIVPLPEAVRGLIWLLPPALLGLAVLGGLQAMAQGHGAFSRVSAWLVGSAVFQLVWIGWWVEKAGMGGLWLGMAIQALVLVPVAWWWFPRTGWQWPHRRWKTLARAWVPFLAAGLASALLAPLSQIAMRGLALRSGWDGAGQWQAAVRLTDAIFVTWNGAVGAWFLSHYAADSSDPSELWKLLPRVCAATLVPVAVLGGLAPLAVGLAYGPGFDQAVHLLRLQLGAEILRTGGWIFSVSLLARRRARAVVALELGGAVVLCGTAALLQPFLGTSALPLAAFVDTLFCLLFGIWLWRRECDRKRT